eukprot:TRINITY_DN9004_c0_g2_i2.p1 TRINITY_DN9004_c0_g2~~TRINITY_DN9004_c0_g2_i2.p1  ORF type:complete len:559 (+),score=139.04 TRINITY_DN9004_c0_g2_i2:106-1782(+)
MADEVETGADCGPATLPLEEVSTSTDEKVEAQEPQPPVPVQDEPPLDPAPNSSLFRRREARGSRYRKFLETLDAASDSDEESDDSDRDSSTASSSQRKGASSRARPATKDRTAGRSPAVDEDVEKLSDMIAARFLLAEDPKPLPDSRHKAEPASGQDSRKASARTTSAPAEKENEPRGNARADPPAVEDKHANRSIEKLSIARPKSDKEPASSGPAPRSSRHHRSSRDADELPVLVIDTNRWLEPEKDKPHNTASLRALAKLDARVVVPMAVMRELDRLKMSRNPLIANQARQASGVVHDCVRSGDFHVQRLDEMISLGGEARPRRNDEEILICCLYFQQQSKEGRVVLLTGDHNLYSTAVSHGIVATSSLQTVIDCNMRFDFPARSASTKFAPAGELTAKLANFQQKKRWQEERAAEERTEMRASQQCNAALSDRLKGLMADRDSIQARHDEVIQRMKAEFERHIEDQRAMYAQLRQQLSALRKRSPRLDATQLALLNGMKSILERLEGQDEQWSRATRTRSVSAVSAAQAERADGQRTSVEERTGSAAKREQEQSV